MAASSCKPAWGEQKFSFEKKTQHIIIIVIIIDKNSCSV